MVRVAADAFGNALGNSIVGAMRPGVDVPDDVRNMGTEAERAYEQAVSGGLNPTQAYAAAASAATPESGMRTFAYDDVAANLGEPTPLYINDNGVAAESPSFLDSFSRESMRDYWTGAQDNADSFLEYAGAGIMRTLGDVGYGIGETAVAMYNDPASTFAGLGKGVVNFGPEAFNSGVNLAKTSFDGLTLLAESTLAPEGYFEGFRETDPYNIDLLKPYANQAEAGGGFLTQIGIGAGAAKYGNYGFTIEDIGAAGAGARQMGAVGVRFGKFVNLSSRDDFLAASLSPEANTTYRFDGFKYTTDSLGRAVSSEGRLGYSPRNRFPDIDASIGRTGIDNDIGFHLGADRFGFQGGPLNVVPGNANLNASAYKALENQLAGYVDAGKRVNASFNAVYNRGNTTVRPDAFAVRYQVDSGKWVSRRFINRPGG